jgi:hypothetical protein
VIIHFIPVVRKIEDRGMAGDHPGSMKIMIARYDDGLFLPQQRKTIMGIAVIPVFVMENAETGNISQAYQPVKPCPFNL